MENHLPFQHLVVKILGQARNDNTRNMSHVMLLTPRGNSEEIIGKETFWRDVRCCCWIRFWMLVAGLLGTSGDSPAGLKCRSEAGVDQKHPGGNPGENHSPEGGAERAHPDTQNAG